MQLMCNNLYQITNFRLPNTDHHLTSPTASSDMPMTPGLLPVHSIGKIELKNGDGVGKNAGLPPTTSTFVGSAGL